MKQMKKMMNKLKSMMNNEPKVFVLLLTLVLFIIVFITYRIADVYLNHEYHEKGNYYIHIAGNKVPFQGDTLINKKKVISNITTKSNLSLDGYIIYSKSKVIFTEKMIVLDLTEGYRLYKTNEFTYLSKGNIITKDYNEEYGKYVFYNGHTRFLFVDDGVLSSGGSSVELSGITEVRMQLDKVDYYNHDLDKYGSIPLNGEVTYTNGYYKVNLTDKTVGNKKLAIPSSTKYLDNITSIKEKK